MIADVSEFVAARALIDREVMILKRHGRPEPKRLMVGAMIEVPALLWQLDSVLPLADFASVGSNDLMQFLFAADRGNMRVSERFDALNPAGLKALKLIVEAAKRHEVPLTLCGEMAGRPLEAMTLIGLGFRSISMAPASVGPVKAMVLSLDAGNLALRLDRTARNQGYVVARGFEAFRGRTRRADLAFIQMTKLHPRPQYASLALTCKLDAVQLVLAETNWTWDRPCDADRAAPSAGKPTPGRRRSAPAYSRDTRNASRL